MAFVKGLILKHVKSIDRTMYLYYPDYPRHTPHKVTGLIVLRGNGDEASVRQLLADGLQALSEEHHIVLAFPNPLPDGWNDTLDPDRPDDLSAINTLLNEISKEDDDPIKVNWIGIPELSEMLRQWTVRNDCKCLLGVDGGAAMAYAFAATRPSDIAAVCGIGGGIPENAVSQAGHVPVTAELYGASEETVRYFCTACQAEMAERKAPAATDENVSREAVDEVLYINPVNACAYVADVKSAGSFAEILARVYDRTFSKVRRINTGKGGDMGRHSDLSGDEFSFVINSDILGDGFRHTWLLHVPKDLPKGENVPLLVFCHGGSENPEEAAHMSKFHELARKEHFITVYPWGTNTAGWDINFDGFCGTTEYNADEVYLVKLIDHLTKTLPVDSTRVYLSGFSNGAGMAQVIAMLHPEKIAALIHIDSNWPGNRWKPMYKPLDSVPAMKRALEEKAGHMRMPVWYTYGTREPSCPVYNMSTQQYQYDFWKTFNNIEVKATADAGTENSCPSGVPGDVVEILPGAPEYPEQYYTVNRFYTRDEKPENYYNFVLMHDKGHEIAPMDPVYAWNYAKQFRRNPDGSVERNS